MEDPEDPPPPMDDEVVFEPKEKVEDGPDREGLSSVSKSLRSDLGAEDTEEVVVLIDGLEESKGAAATMKSESVQILACSDMRAAHTW